MGSSRPEVVIPAENAVFRLDARGRWCNRHGVFRNRRISEHFHAAIRRDAGGYHLHQELPDRVEKVYFPYEDTALFVVQVALGEPVALT
ncbi:MAG: MFS transporter permease, partial [Desulfobacterales bacterium]|nr:MFS transporter permease [Desulfobacterales bacterium]